MMSTKNTKVDKFEKELEDNLEDEDEDEEVLEEEEIAQGQKKCIRQESQEKIYY